LLANVEKVCQENSGSGPLPPLNDRAWGVVKLVIERAGQAPLEIEGFRVRVFCGLDHFEFREQGGLLIKIEEHAGGLATDLAVFPNGGNSVRLKGGLR